MINVRNVLSVMIGDIRWGNVSLHLSYHSRLFQPKISFKLIKSHNNHRYFSFHIHFNCCIFNFTCIFILLVPFPPHIFHKAQDPAGAVQETPFNFKKVNKLEHMYQYVVFFCLIKLKKKKKKTCPTSILSAYFRLECC